MKKTISLAVTTAVAALFVLLFLSARNEGKQVKVTTGDITDVTANGAACRYTRTLGTWKVTEHGVCVNKEGNPFLNAKGVLVYRGSDETKGGIGTQAITSKAVLSRLSAHTLYYAKAYVKLSDGSVVYGSQKNFTTL